MTAFVGFPQDSHSFSAAEVGLALAGLLVREGSGLPRVGMLGAGPAVSAVASSWKAEVARFVYVHQVSGAVQLSGVSSPEQLDITPAAGNIPGGQARIDLIVWDPATAALAVVEGTPGTSPVPPSAPGVALVAQVRVNAGDGMVIGGQITPIFQLTRLVGASAPVTGVVSSRSIPAGGATPVAVTFPTPFAAAPIVQATLMGSALRDCNVAVTDVTAAGFTLVLGSNSIVARTGGASWRADPAS